MNEVPFSSVCRLPNRHEVSSPPMQRRVSGWQPALAWDGNALTFSRVGFRWLDEKALRPPAKWGINE
jgi:hypothetical protein